MRIAALLGLLFCLAVPAGLRADSFTDQQPSYTRIASQCGADPSRPSFSTADYVNALADATRAIREAQRSSTSSRDRIAAIQGSVSRLRECQAEEERKIPLRPISNCRQFVNEFAAASARATDLVARGRITTADRDRVREYFRVPAMNCVRDMMSKCIDPTKTSNVDFVIEVMRSASGFGFVYSYSKQGTFERGLTQTNPFFVHMRFCTDTDYACKGDPAACERRTDQIQAIMQTYMDK